MEQHDWKAIDAAIDELDSLLTTFDAPRDFPATLEAIERVVSVFDRMDVANDKCMQLRRLSRHFYANRSRRNREMSEVVSDHNWMIETADSMRMRIAMLKQ